MKKEYLIILIPIILVFASCKKFLDTKPQDNLFPEGYYNTQQQLNFGINSVYNSLFASPIYGSNALYMLGWEADEGYMNRNSIATGPFRNNPSNDDAFIRDVWRILYDGINRANGVLANVDNNTAIVDTFRNNIRGEALFIRGYFYFLLAQNFGGVPLKLSPSNSVVDVKIQRASLKETYDQVIKDMTEAEGLVKDITTLGFGGRVSKSAVRGVLARVCLNMAGEPLKDATKYQEAVNWCLKVINDPQAGHKLNPNYSDVFITLAKDKYDIRESIWEAEYWGNNIGEFTAAGRNGEINGIVNSQNENTGVSPAYMFYTAKLFNSFDDADLRKYWCIPFFNLDGSASAANGAKVLLDKSFFDTEAKKYGRSPGKFRREFEVVIPKSRTRTPINVPLLRYSDVLLMYAEALNEVSGPTAEAINSVNMVRRRAWSKGVKSITVTSGGSGYTTVPSVTFAGGGSGAVATAVVTDGSVTAINLNRDPTGIEYYQEGNYSSAPAVTLIGGGGSGATAMATIHTPEEADMKAADKASKESFRKFIQKERMRELNFELFRKFDLLRWGIWYETMHDMAAQMALDKANAIHTSYYSNVEPKHLLFPIPVIEMTYNTAMTQNPGW